MKSCHLHHPILLCTLAVAIATANAFGSTISLATADAAAAATTSFNSAGGWADGNAPSAGNDYVVALGDSAGLFLPTAAATFAGDSLAIGDDIGASAAAGFLGSGAHAKWVMKNLILNKGKWTFSATGTAASGTITATVNSPSADPFTIVLPSKGTAIANKTLVNLSGTSFTGGKDAALQFKGADSAPFGGAITISSLKNFKGQLILDGALLQGSQTFFQQIGQADDVFRADRIVVRNFGGFSTGNANHLNWYNSKLGVTVEPTGCRFFPPYSGPMVVGFPVCGTGPIEIVDTTAGWLFTNRIQCTVFSVTNDTANLAAKSKAGIGRKATVAIDDIKVLATYYKSNPGNSGWHYFFCAAETFEKNARIVVDNNWTSSVSYGDGRLYVGDTCAPGLDVTLGIGGRIYTCPEASVNALSAAADRGAASSAIASLDNQGGKIVLHYNSADDAFDCLTVTGAIANVSAAHPLVVQCADSIPAATAMGRYPIFKCAKSALTLTAEMLDISTFKYDDTSKAITLTIAEEGAYWVASVGPEAVATVYLVTGDAAAAATTAFNGNGQQWSDGLAPHSAPYVVALGENEGDGLWFPTASATFGGLSLAIGDLDEDAAGRADFNADNLSYTFDHLYLNKGQLRQHAPGNNRATTFNGEGQVNSTATAPFTICGEAGTITIVDRWLAGEEDAVLVIRGTAATNAFGIDAGSQWSANGYAAYKGRIILDAAYSKHANIAYGGTFKTNAITLRNGGALNSNAANPSWNSNAGITVEASGGKIIDSYGGTLAIYNQIVGGPLTFAGTTTFLHNRTALADFIVTTSREITLCSDATCDNVRYEVRGGTLTFNEGVTFAARAAAPEILVTNATLKAGAGALAALRPVVCAGGVLAIANDGPLCQAASTTNAVLGAGATLRFDVDVENGVCDSLAVLGAATSLTATRESPLRILVKPADASFEPAPDAILTFDLLSLPASIGPVDKKRLELAFTETSCLDGLKLYVVPQGDRQVVRLTNRNPGTCIMLR